MDNSLFKWEVKDEYLILRYDGIYVGFITLDGKDEFYRGNTAHSTDFHIGNDDIKILKKRIESMVETKLKEYRLMKKLDSIVP